MVPRKRGLIAVGLILLLIGGYFLYSYNPAHSYQSTFNILSGRYLKILANLRDQTRLTGAFQESGGNPVSFMIMSSAQFAAFQAANVTANLYALPDASRGDVDWTSTIPDAYYLVFRHGSGLLNTTQTVSFARTYTSLNEAAILAGIALLVLGAVEVYWGFRPEGRPSKAQAAAPGPDVPRPPWP